MSHTDSRPADPRSSVRQTPPHTRPAPVSEAERIGSLDVLRGFAVLGILTMNIGSFSMPSATYQNPTVWGDLTGLNRLVWGLTHVLGDLKFMAIFSMLFGAGMVLMAERREARGGSAWGLHLPRMAWLLLFGLAHAYALWYGDILVWYAVTGTLLFGFRKLSPRRLITLALVLWAVGSGLMAVAGLSVPSWPEEDRTELVADLDGEFARRGKDQALRQFLPDIQPRENRQSEGGGLTRTGLRLPEDVIAIEQRRNRGRLDRGRRLVADLLQGSA